MHRPAAHQAAIHNSGLLWALSCGVLRKVCGCLRQSLVSSALLQFRYSLWPKLWPFHGPCSSTTTLNPLRESSRASTPPEAPQPTIRKSTGSFSCNSVFVEWPVVLMLFPSPVERRSSRMAACR